MYIYRYRHTYLYIETYIYRRVQRIYIYLPRDTCIYIYIITYTDRNIHVYPGTIVTSQSRFPLKRFGFNKGGSFISGVFELDE